MMIRTYSEMLEFETFEERYEYLRLGGSIGAATFGSSRWLNQGFYTSKLWRDTRNFVIFRDEGRDLGIEGREINGPITIHHMNPITEDDVVHMTDILLDPKFLICVHYNTHSAIHFGDASLLPQLPIERSPNDTAPWRL